MFLAKPWAMLGPVKSYYGLNERAIFFCKIVGNPISNISWFYSKCPNLPFIGDCETVELKVSLNELIYVFNFFKLTITIFLISKIINFVIIRKNFLLLFMLTK
jgi:hypothetical protein